MTLCGGCCCKPTPNKPSVPEDSDKDKTDPDDTTPTDPIEGEDTGDKKDETELPDGGDLTENPDGSVNVEI